MISIFASLSSRYHNVCLNRWLISLVSCMVISNQVATCPVPLGPFEDYPSTHSYLTASRNKPQQKETDKLLAIVYTQVISILAKFLSVGG